MAFIWSSGLDSGRYLWWIMGFILWKILMYFGSKSHARLHLRWMFHHSFDNKFDLHDE